MKKPRISREVLWGLGLVIVGGVVGFLPSYFGQPAPQDRQLTIKARKYAYEPAVLTVNRGDRLHIRLQAEDVTHGFYLEGYDVDAKVRPQDPTFWIRHPSRQEDYQKTQEIDLVANRAGKFHYRCSITCGYMHPFMQGELVVRPNFLFPTSVGLLLGLGAALLVAVRGPATTEKREEA